MKNLNQTITSLEVAKMIGVPHSEILKKLEGTKKPGGTVKQIGIIPVLGKGEIPVTDFFIKSSYVTEQNKEMRCYEITRFGCDFLANKFTGEKGIVFTARYVKKFNEMEQQQYIPRINEGLAPYMNGIASYLREMNKRLEKQGSEPYRIVEFDVRVSEQLGLLLPEKTVNYPEYTQIGLFDFALVKTE